MSNKLEFSEFNAALEDEYVFDANPPPGTEVLGALRIQKDYGSGSYAEDGRLEIGSAELANLETEVGAMKPYGSIMTQDYTLDAGPASLGPTEIGGLYPVDGASEIGSGQYALEGASEIGGPYALDGASEIGESGAYATAGASEIGGPYALDGASEIGGPYALDGASEIGGPYALDGASEIGRACMVGGPYAVDGASEIGGPYALDGASEIGAEYHGPYAVSGASEIGAQQAVLKVVEKARDNRQPPPPMRAVDLDAPDLDWSGMDVYVGCTIGAAKGAAKDPFPLTTSLMLRAAASGEPRFVRVDTPESYKAFRAENSPEMAELSARVAELREKFEQHVADPEAHSALVDEIDEVVALGAAVEAEQASKRVQLWMPQRYEGQIEAWMEDGNVCVSMAIPSLDGDVRICTSLEPIRRCVSEMSRHAAEAGVPASSVVGVLPAMGCVLGAGTVIKEVAAAAPEILRHPSASGRLPFMLRIEPKVSPTLAAMAQLAYLCKKGDKQACNEWARLGATAPAPLKRAMQEAIVAIKAA